MPDTVTASFEGAARLADWGVIRAVGPDAASFLHGQLTQDIVGLDIGRAGLKRERDEDQCFAVYDECMSDCAYYAFWASFGDAGVGDAAAPSDGGASDAATRDQ